MGRNKNKIAKYFIDVLAISVIAQLGVLPLLLFYFHQMPLHFLGANFFAVSLLPIVLYGGLIVLVKLFFVLSNSFVEVFYDYFITFYLEVIHYFSSFSNLIVKDISFSKIDLLCYYVFLFCVWYVVDSFRVKRIKQSLSLIIICQLIFLFDVCKQKSASELLMYNSYAQNMITVRNNKVLTILVKDSLFFKDSILLKSNQLKNKVTQFNCNKNSVFNFKKQMYLVVDKNKPYHLLNRKGMALIIGNNPKINMERLMMKLRPKKVIITRFNYKSNQLKWKSTCKKLQVPFYCIAELGAYVKN